MHAEKSFGFCEFQKKTKRMIIFKWNLNIDIKLFICIIFTMTIIFYLKYIYTKLMLRIKFALFINDRHLNISTRNKNAPIE